MRPFRTPYDVILDVGLVGGGPLPRPGEVSLAHSGILFLGERPECPRHVLDVLRPPLENAITENIPPRPDSSGCSCGADVGDDDSACGDDKGSHGISPRSSVTASWEGPVPPPASHECSSGGGNLTIPVQS